MWTIGLGQTCLNVRTQLGGQRRGTLDFSRMLQLMEPHQTLELVCQCQVTTTFGSKDLLHYLANRIFIQISIGMTSPKEMLSVTFYLFELVHRVVSCRAVSSESRC